MNLVPLHPGSSTFKTAAVPSNCKPQCKGCKGLRPEGRQVIYVQSYERCARLRWENKLSSAQQSGNSMSAMKNPQIE